MASLVEIGLDLDLSKSQKLGRLRQTFAQCTEFSIAYRVLSIVRIGSYLDIAPIYSLSKWFTKGPKVGRLTQTY